LSAASPSAWPAWPTPTTVEINGHGSTSIVATPDTKAYPAPDATPGGRWHRHPMSIGLAPALGFGE
jgi:hypothetical protein